MHGSLRWQRTLKTIAAWLSIYTSFKLAQVHCKLIPPDKRGVYWKKIHSHIADSIWYHISDLKGWWVKVGQFLSTRPDVLPPDYISKLELLQDMMPTTNFTAIKQIIERELRCELTELFEYIDPVAIAAASIGQVHKAKLITGEDVIIKVQHPNIDEMLSQDMKLLEHLSWGINLVEDTMNIESILSEWQKQAELELEFTSEMKYQKQARAAMKKAGSNVIVPKCYEELTTKRVMVQEFIDGFKITDIAKLQFYNVDTAQLVVDIVESFAYQVHIEGMFHGDPHPGNILVMIDAKTGKASPVLLDWGLVKEFDHQARIAFSKFIVSCNTMDVMKLIEAISEMGFTFKQSKNALPINPETYYDAVQLLLTPEKEPAGGKVQLATNDEKQSLWTSRAKGEEMNPITDWPRDIIFFIRVATLLHGLAATLKVKVPFFQILLKKAEQALMQDRIANQVTRGLTWVSRPTSIGGPHGLQERLGRLIRHCKTKCALQIYVQCNDKTLVNITAGSHSPYGHSAITDSSLICAYSLVNTLLSLAILEHVKQQKVKLSDKLNQWWTGLVLPEHRTITIRDVMSGQSGLHDWLPNNLTLNKLAEYRSIIKICENITPKCPRGKCTHYAYYTTTYVLNELLEEIVQFRPAGVYLRKVFLKNHGLQYLKSECCYPVPKQKVDDTGASHPVTEVSSKPDNPGAFACPTFRICNSPQPPSGTATGLDSFTATSSTSTSGTCKNKFNIIDCGPKLKIQPLVENTRRINGAAVADSMMRKAIIEEEPNETRKEYEAWLASTNDNMTHPARNVSSKYPANDTVLKSKIGNSKLKKFKAMLELKQIEHLSHLHLMKARPLTFDPLIYNSELIRHLFIAPGAFRTTARALNQILHQTKSIVGETLYSKITSKVRLFDRSTEGYIGSGGFDPVLGLGFQLFHAQLLGEHTEVRAREILCAPHAGGLVQVPHTLTISANHARKNPIFATANLSVRALSIKKDDMHGPENLPPITSSPSPSPSPSPINRADEEDNTVIKGFGWSDMHGSMTVHYPAKNLTFTILVNDFIDGPQIRTLIHQEILDSFGLKPYKLS